MSPIESLIRKLGSRYVPANAVHFSELQPDQQAKMLERAPVLKEKHVDWLFLKIPRTYTAWWVPFPPPKLEGNAQEAVWTAEDGSEHLYCKPIPAWGEWFTVEGKPGVIGYTASTSADGDINRSGARFDDADGYITWPTLRAGSVTDFFKELFT